MCKKLANEGFNICIVARNEEKMKEKLVEIKD
jgi:short-subunit dehydrogenase